MSTSQPAMGADALEQAMRDARARHDATESFAALQAQLAPRLFRYFRAHSFSPEDAEDLVQRVLARVWQGLPAQRQEDRFFAWLFAIARNEPPAQQRACLLLRVRDELSYEEIAGTLRRSLNTVRNHIAAAKKNLRRRLGVELEIGGDR